MSAVWRASRAAVKRRRLQTFVIGLVVLFSTATVVLGSAVLIAVDAPFDKAFDAQRGAHAVVAFDTTKTTADQVAQTAHRPGVQAAAGPFGVAVLRMSHDWGGHAPGPLTVVGRADPGGAVDRVDLLFGRWPTGPGEIVLNLTNGQDGPPEDLGTPLQPDGVPPLTIVGYATSMSQTASGWVTPAQLTALRPTAWQMLYRFTASGTDAQVRAGLAVATAGIPPDAVVATQSSFALKAAFSEMVRTLLPFLVVFGVLGLAVSALIVGNVVTGAVVSGYRHIGVLKAIGFTSRQVVAVYLAMIGVPALAGGLLGAVAGTAMAGPLLRIAFTGIPVGTASLAPSPWAPPAGLALVLVLVVVTALVPALRAGRLSATQAISAGSAPRAGRGLRVQRALAGTRLPRPVSLGLGQPFTRPGRTALTLAAIVLGVGTMTLTTGLTGSIAALMKTANGSGAPELDVSVGSPDNGHAEPKLDDAGIEALLRSLPGVRQVRARAFFQVTVVGFGQPVYIDFYRGPALDEDAVVLNGRLPTGPGEIAAGRPFLTLHDVKVGDRMTVVVGGRQETVTIVGEIMAGASDAVDSDWATLATLAPGTAPVEYRVVLAPGSSSQSYAAAVTAAEPGLVPLVLGAGSAVTISIITFSTVFSALLILVAALGVVNTVLLNIRERRRDLGVLKSIGMTPRQVVGMTLASVAVLGAAGGLLGVPIGIIAHRLIVDNLGTLVLPESMKDIWSAAQLAGLALVGVVIALLGALLPARSAARLPVAAVLHTE